MSNIYEILAIRELVHLGHQHKAKINGCLLYVGTRTWTHKLLMNAKQLAMAHVLIAVLFEFSVYNIYDGPQNTCASEMRNTHNLQRDRQIIEQRKTYTKTEGEVKFYLTKNLDKIVCVILCVFPLFSLWLLQSTIGSYVLYVLMSIAHWNKCFTNMYTNKIETIYIYWNFICSGLVCFHGNSK